MHESARLFVLARHAESSANVRGVVSSDPARAVGLTARGKAQARQLAAQLASLEIGLAVCSSLVRTQQTLELALRGRSVPVVIEPGLDEIRAGDFDGKPIDAYRSWREHHRGSERFPRGESVDQALLRYADALRSLLSRTETANALPYLFDQRAVERAATGLEASAQADLASTQQPRPLLQRLRVYLPWIQSSAMSPHSSAPSSQASVRCRARLPQGVEIGGLDQLLETLRHFERERAPTDTIVR